MNQTTTTKPPITYLPHELLDVCKLNTQQGVVMKASEGLLVLFNAKMVPGEMVSVIADLHEIADTLKTRLVESCGLCDNCEDDPQGSPQQWRTECTAHQELLDPKLSIQVPDFLRKEAGIPLDAKLDAYADDESGEIIVLQAEYNYDISDVPEFLLKELLDAGICLPALEEALRMENPIYAK